MIQSSISIRRSRHISETCVELRRATENRSHRVVKTKWGCDGVRIREDQRIALHVLNVRWSNQFFIQPNTDHGCSHSAPSTKSWAKMGDWAAAFHFGRLRKHHPSLKDSSDQKEWNSWSLITKDHVLRLVKHSFQNHLRESGRRFEQRDVGISRLIRVKWRRCRSIHSPWDWKERLVRYLWFHQKQKLSIYSNAIVMGIDQRHFITLLLFPPSSSTPGSSTKATQDDLFTSKKQCRSNESWISWSLTSDGYEEKQRLFDSLRLARRNDRSLHLQSMNIWTAHCTDHQCREKRSECHKSTINTSITDRTEGETEETCLDGDKGMNLDTSDGQKKITQGNVRSTIIESSVVPLIVHVLVRERDSPILLRESCFSGHWHSSSSKHSSLNIFISMPNDLRVDRWNTNIEIDSKDDDLSPAGMTRRERVAFRLRKNGPGKDDWRHSTRISRQTSEMSKKKLSILSQISDDDDGKINVLLHYLTRRVVFRSPMNHWSGQRIWPLFVTFISIDAGMSFSSDNLRWKHRSLRLSHRW
jgi:hypothetical protein